MIILEDTRNQVGKHDKKNEYFRQNGIEIRRTKLYCGDYTLPTDQSVCIDTKKDIQELIGNMWNILTKTRIHDWEDRFYWEERQMNIFDFMDEKEL